MLSLAHDACLWHEKDKFDEAVAAIFTEQLTHVFNVR